MEDLILIGFGGHAKSVADSVERAGQFRIVGYTDLEDKHNRFSYLGTEESLKRLFDRGITNAFIGIGYLGKGHLRENLYAKLKEIGFSLPSIVDPSAVVSEHCVIEEGVFIGKNAVVNAEAVIRKMAIINTHVIIEHECEIGPFSHVAVGAVVCGHVKVGTGCFIGANSTLVQNINVCDGAFIRAGAVIS